MKPIPKTIWSALLVFLAVASAFNIYRSITPRHPPDSFYRIGTVWSWTSNSTIIATDGGKVVIWPAKLNVHLGDRVWVSNDL